VRKHGARSWEYSRKAFPTQADHTIVLGNEECGGLGHDPASRANSRGRSRGTGEEQGK